MPLRPAVAALVVALAVLVGCQDVRPPAQQAADWWPPGQRAAALCVIEHESGGDPHAVSPGGGNFGLLQINRVHAGDFERLTGRPFVPGVFDPHLAGEYGYALWVAVGGRWSPTWSTARACGLR